MFTGTTIFIASPHSRNDVTEEFVRSELVGARIIRIRDKNQLSSELLGSVSPNWIFFTHWSWPIAPDIYNTYRCVIFHMTDLPYGRGGSPLQNLIVRGHTETRLTAIACTGELDAGPIYLKRPLSLIGSAEEILRSAGRLSGEMILDIVRENPTPVAQEGSVVVFSRRKPEQSDISKLIDAKAFYDHIRMLDAEDYPPAFVELDHMKLEFRNAVSDGEVVSATVTIRRKR